MRLLNSSWQSHANASQSSNSSASRDTPSTGARAWIILVLMFATLFANGVILVAYARNRHLRTPFSIYLIGLCLADISQALFVDPGIFLTNLSPVWPLGHALCGVHQYFIFTVIGCQFTIHLLIGLNRFWAVTFPVHYRHHHSRKLAVAALIGAFLYANAWVLPAVIPDAMYYRKRSATYTVCLFNYEVQGMWAFWVNILMYDLPGIVIVLIYPFIIWKSRMRHRLRFAVKVHPQMMKRKPESVTAQSLNESAEIAPPSAGHPSKQRSADTVTMNSQSAGEFSLPAADRQPVRASSHSSSEDPAVTKLHASRGQAHIRVLTLLVASMIICWTPICTYFTMTGFARYYNFTFVQVANFLYHTNSLLNPIVYPLASPEWRRAFKEVLHLN